MPNHPAVPHKRRRHWPKGSAGPDAGNWPRRSNALYIVPVIRALYLGLCVFLAGRAAGEEPPAPLPWQEPGGLARLFLQLPFEAPTVADPETFQGELRLLYLSTIMVETGPLASIDLYYETAQLTGFVRYGVMPGLELQLAVPVSVDYGGFLNGFIETVEGLFNAANPNRRTQPSGVTWYRVSYRGSTVWTDGPKAGLGDIWIGAKGALLDQEGWLPALALRGAVKFPTGRYPFGSGEVDIGGSLFFGWGFNWIAVRVQIDGITPTADLRAVGIPTRPYGAIQLGFAISPSRVIGLHFQLSASTSPLHGTGLDDIDDGVRYALLGISARVSRSWELEFGVVENIWSPDRGADFTILLGARGDL